MNKKEKVNIDSLTATRAFAALLVVAFHFANINTGISYIDRFFKNGNLAVSYFFALFGYIMYLSFVDNYRGYKNFIQRRIARIIPLYWVALILPTLLVAYAIIIGIPPNFNLGLAFLCNATFTQIYFEQYLYALNTPGWSICVEMSFYLLFPLLLKFQKARNKLFIGATIFAYFSSAIIHNILVNNRSWELFANGSPFLHLNQFLIGMLAAQLFRSNALKNYFYLSIISYDFGLSAKDGLLAPVFAIFIGSIAALDPSFLKTRPLVFLGEISYGIYILQKPVYIYFNLIYLKFSNNQIAGFIIYVFLLIAVSTLLYYIVEIPCKRWINNLGNKKVSTLELKVQPEVLTEA